MEIFEFCHRDTDVVFPASPENFEGFTDTDHDEVSDDGEACTNNEVQHDGNQPSGRTL